MVAGGSTSIPKKISLFKFEGVLVSGSVFSMFPCFRVSVSPKITKVRANLC